MPAHRTPRHLRIAMGNPSKRPLPPPCRAESADLEAPPPDHLNPAARTIWQTLLPRLVAEKTLAAVDLGLLAGYCEATATAEAETAAIEAEGTVVETPHGAIVSPRVRVRADAVSRALKLAAVLGIGPGNRTKAARLETDDADADDKYFARTS